jgi:hypothetical protein
MAAWCAGDGPVAIPPSDGTNAVVPRTPESRVTAHE